MEIELTLGTPGWLSEWITWKNLAQFISHIWPSFLHMFARCKSQFMLEGTETWRKGLELMPLNPLGVFLSAEIFALRDLIVPIAYE